MKLSVIVPVFNEAATLKEIISRIRRVEVDKEIIIVDDGSSDESPRIITSLSSPDIVKLRHPENRGKGAAIRTALDKVRGEMVIIQDADLEYNPKDYARLITAHDAGADVVYGSRFLGKKRPPAPYIWGNWFLTFLTNLLYRSHLSDMETCYKLFRTEVIKKIAIEAKSFDFEPEITAKILKLGYEIKEVPISYERRGYSEGKKITFYDGIKAIISLLKYRLRD